MRVTRETLTASREPKVREGTSRSPVRCSAMSAPATTMTTSEATIAATSAALPRRRGAGCGAWAGSGEETGCGMEAGAAPTSPPQLVQNLEPSLSWEPQ